MKLQLRVRPAFERPTPSLTSVHLKAWKSENRFKLWLLLVKHWKNVANFLSIFQLLGVLSRIRNQKHKWNTWKVNSFLTLHGFSTTANASIVYNVLHVTCSWRGGGRGDSRRLGDWNASLFRHRRCTCPSRGARREAAPPQARSLCRWRAPQLLRALPPAGTLPFFPNRGAWLKQGLL